MRVVAALDDPVGEELERRRWPAASTCARCGCRSGVIAVVYEARPNVTIDCAALTIKSGNAIVLRGSSYAERSNGALAAIVREALAEAGLPRGRGAAAGGRRPRGAGRAGDPGGLVDLLIPRGGEG